MAYDISQIRSALVAAAHHQWSQGVVDFQEGEQPTPHLIQCYFEETEWSWFLDKHSDGTYTEKWRAHSFQEWCGLFIAYCGLQVGRYLQNDQCAGVQLDKQIVKKVMPSTERLASPTRWYSDCPPFAHPGKMKLHKGDVITVGDGRHGSHICLVRENRQAGKQLVKTYEGNAYGELGTGERGEGVIRRTRKFDEIKQMCRFTRDHFVEV